MATGMPKRVKNHRLPMAKILMNLCNNTEFKRRVIELRRKWQINYLAKSGEEAMDFWKRLCTSDTRLRDYHDLYDEGATQSQKFRSDLEGLCRDPIFGLPPDSSMFLLVYDIVLRIDLDMVSNDDILTLPCPPALSKVNICHKDNRLYIDVTFASKKDVYQVWDAVAQWQSQVRPFYIKRGMLPPLVARHPRIPDEVCLQVVELRDNRKSTWKEIGTIYGWPLQASAENKAGEQTRSRCRTAEVAYGRGKMLRGEHVNITSP